MKTTKRVLAVIMSLLMALSFTGVAASADGSKKVIPNYNAIAPGDVIKAELTEDNDTATYSFTPETSGTYYFWTDSDYESSCTVRKYGEQIASGSTDGSENDFCVSCDFTADERYILTVESSHTVYVLLANSFTATHDYEETIKEATCESQGYTEYTCTRCGKSGQDTTDSLGHDIVNGVCSRCGLVCEDIALGDAKEVTSTGRDEPALFRFIPETSGTYYFWIDSAASYSEASIYDSKMNELQTKSFNYYNYSTYISQAFTAGETYYITAGTSYSSYGPQTLYAVLATSFSSGHDFGEAVVTTEASCGINKCTSYTCSRCGYTLNITAEALDHNFENGVCTRCGKIINTISAGDTKKIISENYDDYWYAFTPAQSGTYYFWTDSCNGTTYTLYDSDKTTSLNCVSSYSSSLTGNSLSYEFVGGKTYYFRIYGSGVFYVLLSDSYTSQHVTDEGVATSPTCIAEGYTTYTCTRCGYIYEDEDSYTDSLGHDYKDGICTRCGNIKKSISVGDAKEVTVSKGGEKVLFEFIPAESGKYYFYSDSQDDTYGVLYDKSMSEINCNDDGGDDRNFKISYDFVAGETYYLEARYYYNGNTGSFFAVLSDSYTSCHNYEKTGVTEPGCTSYGYTEYTCSICGYTDRSDYVDPSGHDYKDGVCTKCGEPINEILPGDVKKITVTRPGSETLFRFIPEKSGRYYFTLDSSEEVHVSLLDSNMNELRSLNMYDYDDGRICYTFLKGETYWFACGLYSDTGTYYAILSDSFTSRHAYDAGTEHTPTCTEEGYTEYTCSRCGYTDWTDGDEALGHDFRDGVCTRCGRALTDISLGEVKKLTATKTYDEVIMRFIPEKDGTYYFWPDVSHQVTFRLYDSDRNLISEHRYNPEYENSFIAYSFKAGETYYFTIDNLYETDNGRAFAILSDDYSSSHTLVVNGEVPASCLSNGGKGTVCSRCGYVLDAAETYDALGHNFENGVCSRCGEKCEYVKCDETQTIPAETYKYNWISFTPTVDGSYHFGFTYDGKYVEYGLYKNNGGLYCYTYNDYYNGTGLDYDLEAGTEYLICIFNYENDTQNVGVTVINNDIANCTHEIVNHEGKPATCTENGWEAYETCTKCAYTTYKAISATGHTPAEAVKENVVAATCTAGGSYDSVVYCSVCKAELSRETIKVDAAGHKDENEDGYCDICNALLNADLANPCRNAVINVAEGRKIDYRSKVIITATADNIPDGYYLAIYTDGKQVATGTNTEVSFTVNKLTSDINYTVKVIDANGNVQKDSSGNDLVKDGGTITCNSGFFTKIIAFFKGIFGLLPEIAVKPKAA